MVCSPHYDPEVIFSHTNFWIWQVAYQARNDVVYSIILLVHKQQVIWKPMYACLLDYIMDLTQQSLQMSYLHGKSVEEVFWVSIYSLVVIDNADGKLTIEN